MLGAGMWGDVVRCVSEVETPSSWATKEKKALHIIQLSCGREIVDEISHFKTAKDAWNYLMTSYGDELKASADAEQGTYIFNHYFKFESNVFLTKEILYNKLLRCYLYTSKIKNM